VSPAARRAALALAALAAIAGSSAAATRTRVFRGAHEREISLQSYRRSGSIALSDRTLRIDLAIARDGRTVPFPDNGTYRVRR
jgi:hypothetical protein